jgi:hypothetical protein
VPELLPSKVRALEAVGAAEQAVRPVRDCRAASAAWAAVSAVQRAVRGVVPLEAVPQAVEHKPLIISTKGPQVEGRAEQPRPRREARALAAAQPKEHPEAREQRQPEAQAWLAQRQPEAQVKLSKDVSPRKRNSGLPGRVSVSKKTN